MMTRVLTTARLTVAAAGLTAAVAGCWETAPATAGATASLLWHYPSGVSCRVQPPAADSEQVYVPFADGYVRALSRATGTLRWQTYVGGSLFDDIKVFAGRVLVLGGGVVDALDPVHGTILWAMTDSTDRPGGALSFDSLTGIVVAGAWHRSLWGVRVSDGSIAWKVDLGERTTSTAIAGRAVYAGTINDSAPPVDAFGHVFAVSLDSRQQLWSFYTPPAADGGGGFGAPLTVAGGVVVGIAVGHAYAVDAGSGQELWYLDLPVWLGGAVSDGRLAYIPTNNGKLYARDLQTGGKVWTDSLNYASLYTQPVLMGDSLVVTMDGNTLYAIRRSDGDVLWTYQVQYNNICSTPLVVGNDVVFAAEDGVYAVRPSH